MFNLNFLICWFILSKILKFLYFKFLQYVTCIKVKFWLNTRINFLLQTNYLFSLYFHTFVPLFKVVILSSIFVPSQAIREACKCANIIWTVLPSTISQKRISLKHITQFKVLILSAYQKLSEIQLFNWIILIY